MEPAPDSTDKPFTLGGPILHSADTPAHVPGQWRSDLLHRYLDSADRAAVAQTCRTALELLLDEWPHPTLRVPVHGASEEDADTRLRRMHAARRALARRRKEHTTLALVQGRGEFQSQDAWWAPIFDTLSSGRQHPKLTLSLHLIEITPQLIMRAVQAFPGLASLQLSPPEDDRGRARMQLPAPSAFPALRHLTIRSTPRDVQGRLWASIGPYLPQLHSLTVTDAHQAYGPADQPLWVYYFGQHISRTLQRLSVPTQLTPVLVSMLQVNAPSLRQLTVSGVQEEVDASDTGAFKPVCSWDTLNVSESQFSVQCLSWLPMPEGGKKLTVHVPKQKAVRWTLPVTDKVAQALARVHIQGSQCFHVSAGSLAPDEQPAALHAALQHMAPHIHTPDIQLVLQAFTVSAPLSDAVAAAAGLGFRVVSMEAVTWPAHMALAAPLPPLCTLDLPDALDDALLATVLRGVRVVDRLCVPELSLQTALPAGTVLPWRTLCVNSVHLSEWVRQAELFRVGTKWELDSVYISFIMYIGRHAHETEIQQLKRFIPTAAINTVYVDLNTHAESSIDFVEDSDGEEIVQVGPLTVSDVPPEAQPPILHACLAVARALPCAPQSLHVRGWAATAGVVSAVSGLPHWPAELWLHLQSCGRKGTVESHWPLSRAAWSIPRSYPVWHISPHTLDPEELKSLIYQAPGDRTAEQPLHIRVQGKDQRWLFTVKERMTQLGQYPHVTVTG